MPEDVQWVFGHALDEAQAGGKHSSAKALRGFGGASVLELVEDDSSGTYRAVYTVRFAKAVYVLHCFQKKSKRGISTPQTEVDKIRKRLNIAEQHYREHYGTQSEPQTDH